MNLLLDTDALIWALEDSLELKGKARDAIINGENIVFVSAATIWEISIKKSTGKLKTPDNLFEEIRKHRFTPLDMNFEHALLAGELPPIHKDPFDRMLIAQAKIEKLSLLSRDSFIAQYDVDVIAI